MEFRIETVYDARALYVMARTLRKTVRKKHSRRSRILGWALLILTALLTFPLDGGTMVWSFRTGVNLVVLLALLCVLLFEDRINGFVAGKRMLRGTEHCTTVFEEEAYRSETELGESCFHYEKIPLVVESKGYFVFVFGPSHAQIYDLSTLSGGSLQEFSTFLQGKTGKEILRLQ